MEKTRYAALHEHACHKSENLPMKIYQTNHTHLHWHEEYEFLLVEKGTALCVINGEPVELTENRALLLHSGDLHSIHDHTDTSVIAIVVSPSFWEDETFTSLFREAIQFQSVFSGDDPVDRSIIEILKQIVEIYNDKPFGYGFVIKSKFSEIFAILLTHKRFTYSQKSTGQVPGELKKLMNYVHEHYAEKISLHTLSGISFYSPTYIIKLFKRYTNFTPAEYIIQYRLELAKEKLRKGSESNVTIAMSCGFNSETYFIRAFKKRYGVTPHAYRKEKSPRKK